MKKYELTDETKTVCGVTLHRIRALTDIERWDVKAGELGGWIEKEANLDQEGNARVYGKARVSGNARVSGEAWVSKTTHVLTVGPIGSRNGTTTFFRERLSAGFAVSVCCGCFHGTVDEFRAKVRETHGNNKHGKAYQLAADLTEAQIELEGDEQDG